MIKAINFAWSCHKRFWQVYQNRQICRSYVIVTVHTWWAQPYTIDLLTKTVKRKAQWIHYIETKLIINLSKSQFLNKYITILIYHRKRHYEVNVFTKTIRLYESIKAESCQIKNKIKKHTFNVQNVMSSINIICMCLTLPCTQRGCYKKNTKTLYNNYTMRNAV